jgi:hypothetical protein
MFLRDHFPGIFPALVAGARKGFSGGLWMDFCVTISGWSASQFGHKFKPKNNKK